MSDIFQIGSIGMHEGQQRLAAISLNAASASVPGYRRHVVVGRPFDAVMWSGGAASSGAAAMRRFTTSAPAAQVDLSPGALIATGRALDVAIDGDGLFLAVGDGNAQWLTRAGQLRLDSEGVLVGEAGLRLVGANGDVRLPSPDVEIAPDGRITHQGVVVGALQLFRASDRTTLQAASGSLLSAPGGIELAEAGAGRVRSGHLEASNTDPTREMLGVMALSRQFESLSQVLRGVDGALGRAIQTLGEA
jgi:flagellar basal-body rod protein FlgF